METGDHIVYYVYVRPGGIDGLDRTDKGGIKFATFDHKEAKKHVDAWSEIRKDVVDVDAARIIALAKLNPLDKLVLGL